MVTWENYDEYLMLQADDELSEAETAALEQFLEQHPELRAEQKAYASVKLQPDACLVYEDKTSLMKTPPAARTISLRQWWVYGAAAASVALMLFIGLRPEPRQAVSPAGLARTQASAPAPAQSPLQQAQHHQPESQAAAAPAQVPVQQPEPETAIAAAGPDAPIHAPQPEAPLNGLPVLQQPLQLHTEPELRDMPVLALMPEPQSLPQIPVSDQLPLPGSSEPELLAWLPDHKKQGISELKDAVENRLEQVRSLKQQIRGTAFSLQLGNQKIATINF